MDFGRAVRVLLGLFLTASLMLGCGGNPAAEQAKDAGKQASAPVRPKMKAAAAKKLQDRMPHL